MMDPTALCFAGAVAATVTSAAGYNLAAKKPSMEKLGFWALILATLAMVGAIAARGYLAGRSPVSNFYEAMLWTIGIAMIVVLVIDRTYKPPHFAAWMTPFLLLLLGITYMFPSTWKEINPLVPALRSYWLKIHVMTIVSSYGAFAVSFLTSVMYLVFKRRPVRAAGESVEEAEAKRKRLLTMLDEVTYRTILLGVPLLGVGTILGGLWANEAWGNYWSWDPKETWSLITFLIYMAYLHMRLIKGVTGEKAIWFSLVGFAAVIFTFFGVNYLPGLHSYGFST